MLDITRSMAFEKMLHTTTCDLATLVVCLVAKDHLDKDEIGRLTQESARYTHESDLRVIGNRKDPKQLTRADIRLILEARLRSFVEFLNDQV